MLSSAKRFILPFSTQKGSEPEVEAAAVFAIAEIKRNKGGGFVSRLSEERLVFLSKVGYPLWLFPKNDATFVFDGLNDSSYSVSYAEVTSTEAFLESLEANAQSREKYLSFLSDNDNYFEQPTKDKHFTLRGLIADPDFKDDFSVYRKEAIEVIGSANLALLLPILDETAISSMLAELDKLQSVLREDIKRLPECIRLVNKTTSQYLTELDYEGAAVQEEADAKIRAQEELVNPQIAKLNKDYRGKIKDLTERFDQELEGLDKLRTKTAKSMEANEDKIKLYQREAKAQSKKGHAIYEKRWKEKIKQNEREFNGLKKELKSVENSIKKLNKEKTQETSKLYSELDSEVKFARQPLLELEAACEAKLLVFKRESAKLIALEKPVIDGLNRNIKLREAINANFEALGMKDQQLKSQCLFYIPFYVACYEIGLRRRYIAFPPSTVNSVNFSARLKGALGVSRIKDLLKPRFRAITSLIAKVQVLAQQNSVFESQLGDLGERNNLLRNSLFLENAVKGLVYLEHEGWLSERERQVLSTYLTSV